jgi:excinuclease UvrABC ATPase subunit
MKKKILLLCLLLVSSWQVRVATASQEELYETLQKKPWDALAMQKMQVLLRNEREPAALRSRAMALCALALIKQGNTNQFVRAVQLMESAYPEGKGLVTVSVAEQYVTCPVCSGKGKREVSCPSCRGSTCPRCKGTRSMLSACSDCMGAGQQFKLSPSVQDNYNRLLTEILEASRENQRLDKQVSQVLAEKDNDKRIALFEAVLADFPKRTDLEHVQKNLAVAQTIRDVARAKTREQDVREKEELAVERLRGLRQVTSEKRVAAIQEIEGFLIKHPKCFARTELDEIKTELMSQENIRNRLISAGYWLGGIGALFVVVSFLKIMLTPRKDESIRPLPGMDHIDKSKFTDPLADERERTEARRHKEKR